MSPQHPSLWDGSIGVLTGLVLCHNIGRGSRHRTSNPALPAILRGNQCLGDANNVIYSMVHYHKTLEFIYRLSEQIQPPISSIACGLREQMQSILINTFYWWLSRALWLKLTFLWDYIQTKNLCTLNRWLSRGTSLVPSPPMPVNTSRGTRCVHWYWRTRKRACIA